MKLEFLGMQLNIWGLYCTIGALCAVAAMSVVCISRKMKPLSAPVLGLASLLMGMICSRVVYCLFTTLTEVRMPISAWIRLTDGGWSLFGMIGGVMLAAWISAKIVGEEPRRMLDAVSVALPLMIAAERLGEGSLQPFLEETKDLFNLSRPITGNGFLTITNQNQTYLATYLIDAVLALILFLALAFSLTGRKRRDGDLWVMFLVLCGAGGILAESLRKDQYLEYSFVRIQQVFAAVMLFAGVFLSGWKSGKGEKRLYRTALISTALLVAECIGLEFVLDRDRLTHSVLYGVMITALLIPVVESMVLLHRKNAEAEGNGMSVNALMAAALTAVSLSATEVLSMILEMGRAHKSDKFLLLVLFSSAAVFAVHSVMIFLTIREKCRTDGPNMVEGER